MECIGTLEVKESAPSSVQRYETLIKGYEGYSPESVMAIEK